MAYSARKYMDPRKSSYLVNDPQMLDGPDVNMVVGKPVKYANLWFHHPVRCASKFLDIYAHSYMLTSYPNY
jgi:hypothetical protein